MEVDEAFEVPEEPMEVAAPEAAMGPVVAAPVPVGIWLLRAAQVQAATLPHGAHVRVCSIEMDLAPALNLLLAQQIAAREWAVVKLQRVSRLADVQHLFNTGVHAHLALVIDHPHHRVYLQAFSDWSWRLQNTAREVGEALVTGGDSFYKVVNKICRVSRKVVAGHTGKKPDIWIALKLHEILDRISAVQGSTVYLLYPEED